MTTRVITPPTMDINRDMSQSCPDSSVPVPSNSGESGGASLPESAGGCVPMTTSSLGCPSPAISPNSSSSMMMGPTTELILSTRIRSVPRCLFGPPDPLTAQFAREKVKEIREQDKERYNFDFDKEEPMEGPFKWEAVPIAPPSTTTSSSTGSSYAPKAYALSRFPYLSGSMVQMDRGSRPPLRTTINNNQLPPAREFYFQDGRDPLLIVRSVEEERRNRLSSTKSSTPVTSTIQSSTTLSPIASATITSSSSQQSHVPTVDPTLLLPSPDASSCSSEDSANVLDMEMELGEEDASVDSSEEELKAPSNELASHDSESNKKSSATTSDAKIATSNVNAASSSSSGLSSRACSSSSTSSSSSPTSRRTKSVSSSSSSPSASPPSSTQTQITKFLPVRKRSASTTTAKAALESAPASSAANTEKKRAC